MEMFGGLDVDRHLVLVQLLAVREIAGGDAHFLAAVGGIFDDGHGQVDLAGVRLGRGRDGIEPGRDLVGQGQEFRRGERHRVFGQDIGVIPREDVIVERFVVPDDFRQRGFLGAFRQSFQHGLDEFLADAVEDIAVDQQIPQGDRAGGLFDGRGGVEREMGEQVVDRLRKIAGDPRRGESPGTYVMPLSPR